MKALVVSPQHYRIWLAEVPRLMQWILSVPILSTLTQGDPSDT